MNEVDHWVLAPLKQQKEWPEQGFDPDLCDAGAGALPVELSGQLEGGHFAGWL